MNILKNYYTTLFVECWVDHWRVKKIHRTCRLEMRYQWYIGGNEADWLKGQLSHLLNSASFQAIATTSNCWTCFRPWLTKQYSCIKKKVICLCLILHMYVYIFRLDITISTIWRLVGKICLFVFARHFYGHMNLLNLLILYLRNSYSKGPCLESLLIYVNKLGKKVYSFLRKNGPVNKC